MAAPVVAIEATDHFSLGVNFFPQNSTANHVDDMAFILDETGNKECETAGLLGRTEYMTEYAYCNASPDIKTDLTTTAETFGVVANSISPLTLAITYTPGEYATVRITGVQYDEQVIATINTANVSAAIPASSGFGVPTLTGVTLGDNAEGAGLTLTFIHNQVVARGAAGNHFYSQNITFRADATADYVGVPSDYIAPTGWTLDSYILNDSNQEFDTASWTGHRWFDKI